MADTEQIVDDAQTQKSPKNKKLMTLLIAAGLVLGEGGFIFIITRTMYKQPESAAAAAPSPEERALQEIEKSVELALPEVNAFNKREGRLFLFNLHVTILVDKDDEVDVKKVLEIRQSTILDRFNTVIRSADIKYLNEPGLDTLRRQFRFELNQILGDEELVNELLIPRFYQSPADL